MSRNKRNVSYLKTYIDSNGRKHYRVATFDTIMRETHDIGDLLDCREVEDKDEKREAKKQDFKFTPFENLALK